MPFENDISMESKYQYLAKNTVIFAISSFSSRILVFLLVPLYTSVLSTSDYGIADIIVTSTTLLSYVFTLDIADSVLRFAIERKDEQKRILSYGIRVLLFGSVLLAGGIIVFYYSKYGSWNRYYYLFLFLNFFALSLNQIINNYLRAIDKIKEVAIAGIIQTITTIILNILLLLIIRTGVYGYLISIIVGSLSSALYSFIAIKLTPRELFSEHCKKETQKEMYCYSIPLIFNGIAWWINNSIDKYFVIYMLGNAENGVLAISYKIPTILMVFHLIFAQAWNLSAIKEYDKEDKDVFISSIYSFYNAGLVVLCSILILLNIPLARLLYAKEFFVAWKCSSILLFSTLFSCLSGIIGSIFSAVKASRFFAFSTVSSAIINVILNYILIHFWGIIGAAIATAVSYIFVWMIRLFYARKFVNLKINLKKDVFCYFLISVQVIFEHANVFLRYAEILIVLLIIFLYKDSILHLLYKVKDQLGKRLMVLRKE